MLRWYCIQTKPNQEARAARALSDRGFETFFPMGRIAIIKRGAPAEMLKPLLLGYGFVGFDKMNDPWWQIMSARGVRRLLGVQRFSDLHWSPPLHVADAQMAALKARLSEFGGTAPIRFDRPKWIAPGTVVRILFGPYEGQYGPVEVDAGARVEVLLRFAGVRTKFKIPRDCLALA